MATTVHCTGQAQGKTGFRPSLHRPLRETVFRVAPGHGFPPDIPSHCPRPLGGGGGGRRPGGVEGLQEGSTGAGRGILPRHGPLYGNRPGRTSPGERGPYPETRALQGVCSGTPQHCRKKSLDFERGEPPSQHRLRNPDRAHTLQDIQAHVEVPDRMGERAHADDVDPGRGVPGKVAAGNPP